MPLHPPAGSALTSPVYFGLRLNSSRVCTPELLRAHLQTVRQTVQCDFVVIPTASDSSLAASKAIAAEKSKNTVKKATGAARNSHAVRSTHFTDESFGATDASTPITDTDLSLPEERDPVRDKERVSRLSVKGFPTVRKCSSTAHENDSATTLAASAATAESTVLVESPRFATGRATIPVQHLAEVAVDFPAFAKDFLSPLSKSGNSILGDGNCHRESETTTEPPVRRTGKPSFNALDGGLAALPATYAFAPSTESDLALDSQTWNAAVVCELSPWISPDLGVLPGRRKVATGSRACCSRESRSRATVAGRCAAADTSVSRHYPKDSHSAIARAPSGHSHGSTAAATPGEQASNRGNRRAPTATGAARLEAVAQSKEGAEAQDQQTHYIKRSRTAARGEQLERLAKQDGVDESSEVTGGMEQRATKTQDEAMQHPEARCFTDSSSNRITETVDPKEKSSDCSAVASATSAAAEAEFRATHTSSLSSGSVHPATLVCEASTASAPSLTNNAAQGSSSGRRRQRAARREEQLKLAHGLLRHWSFHESAWQREMQWATHVGAFAVITPPPAPDLIPVEYSRLLRAALDQLQPPIIWIKLPLVYSVSGSSTCSSRRSTRHQCHSWNTDQSSTSSDWSSSNSEDTDGEDECGKGSDDSHTVGRSRGNCCRSKPGRRRRNEYARKPEDPWQIWQYIRSMVGPHPSLGLCLEITLDLPDSDDELERWFAEPLRAVVLSPCLFTSSSFANTGKDISLKGMCNGQRSRESGSTGNRFFAAGGAAAQKNRGAVESGVRLSPRHHLFLMKCAQHRVKIIFQFEEDEKDEDELETQEPVPSPGTTAAGGVMATPGRAAALDTAGAASDEGGNELEKSKTLARDFEKVTCEDMKQQPQVGALAAHDFPPLSGSGFATSKERPSQPGAPTLKHSSVKTACHARGYAVQKGGQLLKTSAPPLEEMQPYISYVAQQLLQLPALKQTELFSAPYRDVLQSPMQPLADNLSAGNYEVFEKDPVKYIRYKEATLLRLREIWPDTSTGEQHVRQQLQRKEFEAQQQVKRDARLQQGQTKQSQEQQQGGQRPGRGTTGAAVANQTSVGHTVPDVETQKRRKKNRGRRRGRVAGRKNAYYWECGSDDEEEEGDDASAKTFVNTSCSSSAAASSASASGSFPFSCSGGFPPPPPTASPSFSPDSSPSTHPSDWCLRGADCTLHAGAGPRLVLTIVGAGRGPLVQAALEALREAGIPLCRARVFAVEKNWNAVITLRSRVRSDACIGWRAVEVVEADMREAGDCVAERADILISELLGSFGDNELSAECLDGAQMRLLKKGGVSIPSAYVSSLEPVSTHTLWQAIDSYNDPKQFECAYVVNMFAKYFPAKEGPKECFHYRHPHFLLPFGDEGESISSSGGDNSSTDSSRRWESPSSDSGSDSERTKDSSRRRKRSSSKKETSSSGSGRESLRREREAGWQEGGRGGEQRTDFQSETCKRHEVYACTASSETLHLKGAARSDAQGGGTVAGSGSPEQEDARVRAAAVADTAANCCVMHKKTAVVEETGGSGTLRKCPPGSEELPCVRRGKKQQKKSSAKARCGFTPAQLTVLRHRRTRLSWRMRTDTVVHGLAGYFHCCLYKSVYISIDPRSFSEGMFSWFPLFLPFRQPVYVHRSEKLEVYIARDGDEHKVWYEWAVLQPTPSEIYNHMGKHSYIGK